MGSDPAVSVVMPVRNSVDFVDEAIESIVQQDFGDFELVILDDASRDGTTDRLRAWEQREPRVRLVMHQGEPLGLVRSSNQVVESAQAPLIARMDADDIARPDRLRRQVEIMTLYPDAVLVGSLSEGIDASGRTVRPMELRRLVPGRTVLPCPHPSMMFRRDAFERVDGYPTGSEGWEDTALFARLDSVGRVFIIPEPLLRYRYHVQGSTIVSSHRARTAHRVAQTAFLNELRPSGSHSPEDSDRAGAVDAFLLRAGMRIWSGYPPDLPPTFPSRKAPGWFTKAIRVGLYATWGKVSPRSLRAVMRAGIRLDNRRLARTLAQLGVIEWDTEPS